MDALQNAGRRKAAVYARSTLYTTLSPCPMCGGTAVLYKIPRIVIGENRTVAETTLCEDWLRSQGIEIVNLDLDEPYQLMQTFIQRFPEVWYEDIGY
jgi:cytosine deaminase